MADDSKKTLVPASVYAKMQRGERQRHAIATTQSVNPKAESKEKS